MRVGFPLLAGLVATALVVAAPVSAAPVAGGTVNFAAAQDVAALLQSSASAPYSAAFGTYDATYAPQALTSGLSGFSTDSRQYAVQNDAVEAPLAPGVSIDMGYRLDPATRLGDAPSGALFDGLLTSTAGVSSPYAGLTNGGDYAGASVALADGLDLHLGESVLLAPTDGSAVLALPVRSGFGTADALYDTRQAQSSLAGLDWNFASWGGLGAVATNTSEQNGFLGGFNAGTLSLAKSANTSSVGVSAHVNFGDGWVTSFSYNQGTTQLSLRPDALVVSADTVHSRSYGFAVAKRGLFGDDDSLGLAVSRPLQIYAGGVNIAAAPDLNSDGGGLGVGRQYVSLASGTPETDVEVGYVTTFMDGALALQANAGYQMNVAGLSGTNAISLISRAKINF